MATRAAIATGTATNFTTAGTWGLIDSTSYLNAENATESLLTTSYSDTRSSAFTPGAIEIDGIGVKLCERNGTTGTMSVELYNSTDSVAVSGTEVTINVSDLPAATEAGLNGGWVFFKFASPVTLEAAHDYKVEAKTSSATQVDLFCDSTVDNLSRYLRTTTTGAPAAGDDLIITKDWTAAGTGTAAIVTMNNTDTTDYGSAPTAANSLIGPGIAICNGGTLSFGVTASTAYSLKISNSIIVYSGGTLNIGTVASPMPSTSSGYINFDCGTNVDYGLVIRNLGTFVMQGATKTSTQTLLTASIGGYCSTSGTAVTAVTGQAQSFTGLTGTININGTNYTISSVEDSTHLTLTGSAGTQSNVYFRHSGTANVITVGDTTGWATNDTIAIASTSRTYSECESATISTVDSATQATLSSALTYQHIGTSPTQAEVINLTRNVKIYGAFSSLQSYVRFDTTSTVDIDYGEFYWLGSATSGKDGITVYTTTGSCNFQYSSLHDFIVTGSDGLTLSGSITNNIDFSHNNGYYLNSYGIYTPDNSQAVSTTIISYNVFMRNVAASMTFYIVNASLMTFSNNTSVGSTFYGFSINCSTVKTTYSNLVSHSNNSYGFYFNSQNAEIIYDTCSSWRNTNAGFYFAYSNFHHTILLDCIAFGNTTASITCSAGGVTVDGGIYNGDVVFSTSRCFNITVDSVFKGINMDMDTVSGIKVAHLYTVYASSTYAVFDGTLINCKLNPATSVIDTSLNPTAGLCLNIQKFNQTAGDHRTYKGRGTITLDTTIYHTASPSQRLTVSADASATSKLESGSKKVAFADGSTGTVTVWVRESVAGDGTDYDGNRARLILKRNDAMGVAADTVLDTATASSEGAWEQLSGSITTDMTTDDGVLEFVVDCDYGSTLGWINVDDWSVT